MMEYKNCKWCGALVGFLSASMVPPDVECDDCWEIRTRADRKIEVVEKIIAFLKEQREQ